MTSSTALDRSTALLLLTAGCIGPVGPLEPGAHEPPNEQCAQVELSVEVGAIEGIEQFRHAGLPVVDTGSVYLLRRGTAFANAPEDSEIIRHIPLTGTDEQITANDVNDRIIDARDGAILYLSGSGEGPYRLIYRDATREVILDESVTYPVPYDDFNGPETHLVVNGHAAWLDAELDAVFHFDGTRVSSVSTGVTRNNSPHVFGAFVTWAAFDGNDSEIYLAGPDGTIQLTDNTVPDRSPVITESNVAWVSNGALALWQAHTGETRVLHQGPCSAPAADQGSLVFACNRAADAPPWPSPGEVLYYFDGTNVRELSSSGHHFAPRIHQERIAWLAYDEADALAHGQTESGSVYLYDLRHTSEPIELARVDAPCLACGAYWPSPRLSLARDVLAWSYASGPSSPPFNGAAALAYAFIREQRACP